MPDWVDWGENAWEKMEDFAISGQASVIAMRAVSYGCQIAWGGMADGDCLGGERMPREDASRSPPGAAFTHQRPERSCRPHVRRRETA